MKIILGALAAVALFVGVAASQPADARCFWNGYAMECFHHPHYGYWHQRSWGWDRPYYRHWGWNRW
jgi:cyclic lactone autoinducer peptide